MTPAELKALADTWPRVNFLERYQQKGQEIQPPVPIIYGCLACGEPLRFSRDPASAKDFAVCCPRCDVGAACQVAPIVPSVICRWLAENLDMVWQEIGKDPETYLAVRQEKINHDSSNSESQNDLAAIESSRSIPAGG